MPNYKAFRHFAPSMLHKGSTCWTIHNVLWPHWSCVQVRSVKRMYRARLLASWRHHTARLVQLLALLQFLHFTVVRMPSQLFVLTVFQTSWFCYFLRLLDFLSACCSLGFVKFQGSCFCGRFQTLLFYRHLCINSRQMFCKFQDNEHRMLKWTPSVRWRHASVTRANTANPV